MCGLLAKCAALIVMIHGFRALSRWAGPRWSGLALGLPSTTVIVLLVCGCEHGSVAATAMAESSLLGLVAAVALPLAYMRAVSLGWRLPMVLVLAVGGYFSVALALDCLPPLGVVAHLGIATSAMIAGAGIATRLPLPKRGPSWQAMSPRHKLILRSAVPALYVAAVALVDALAGPRWTGLVGTFPSMSLVVLAVTHLEAGPLEASRIARVLPAGNLSTLSFLACLRGACPLVGLAGGMMAGYSGALLALLLVAAAVRWAPCGRVAVECCPWRPRRAAGLPIGFAAHTGIGATRIHAHARLAANRAGHSRLHRCERTGFSPHVEWLEW
jgi:hypothetical protein